MVSIFRRISALVFVVLLFREAEMQTPTITAAPSSPQSVLEGQSITLEWTYNLSGRSYLQMQLSTTIDGVVTDFQKHSSVANLLIVPPNADYAGRITANVTDTFTTISIIPVKATDSRTYTFTIQNDLGAVPTTPSVVKIEVLVPPSLTARAADRVLVEGDPATFSLSCSASGEPTPNITWTKVFENGSDSKVLFHEAPSSPFVLSNNRSNEGRYRCTANNGVGSPVNHTVSVTVNFKPENVQLNVQSNDGNICRGESVNFTCSASGKPPVHSYQLFANDSLVSGDSNAGFWNQTLSTEGVFIYKCEANNTVGRTNTSRTVPVNVPSAITSALHNITLVEGENRTLSCAVSGLPTPSVSWREPRAGNRSQGNILQLTNISRNDAGEYICESSNVCGNDTKSLFITVHFQPENVQLLASEMTVCRGSMITLNCSADANPMVHTYQLYENGTMVNESSSSGVWSRTMSTAGLFVFTCATSNTVGTTNSTHVSVTVNVKSEILPLHNITVVENDSKNLTCTVTGSPLPSVSWTEVSTDTQSPGNILQLTNITRNDAGEYICKSSNVCGNDTKSLFLTVHFPPENIQLSASETTVCNGSMITLNCSADANPMVHTYQLYENGTMVNESSSSGVWNIMLSQGGTFNYKCVANNTVGTLESALVPVSVNVPSSIQAIPKQTIIELGNLTVTCEASGIPAPSVSWVKVGSNERTNENELVLTNISRSQAGEYRCEATNPCGNASESVTVDVQYPPGNVQLQTSEGKTCLNSTIRLNCSADANPMVHTYQLYENDTLVNEGSSSGVWSRAMSTAGLFFYKCMVNNTLGTESSSTVSVLVNVPSSVDAIENKTLNEGDGLNLTCQASGIPPPSVSWIRVSDGQLTNSNELVFTRINRSEAGEYRCEASNECGNASESAVIVVQFPPENVQLSVREPRICLGSVVTFNCSAYAVPMVDNYQLYENGSLVNESSSSGVWSRTMSSAGVFVYQCMVANSIGPANSTMLTVTVNVRSSINAIKNKTLTEGDGLNLTCQASGMPLPSVSWVRVSDGQRTNSNELVVTNISRSEAGEYRCEASNECSNASESAWVVVQFPPENVQLSVTEPRVCRGAVVTFNCSAYAVPMVHTYQLYENDTLVNESSSSGVWSRTMSTAGYFIYECMVNNTVGTESSSTVAVSVNDPSSIAAIQNQTVREGSNLTLTCQASGKPSPSVSWIRVGDGQLFNSDEVVITSINRSEAGEYRCEASNECGNASESAEIVVQYPPEIIHISGQQTPNNGDALTLNCTADGNPAPTITWTKLSDNTVVTMPLNISKQSEGDYMCSAENSIGAVTRNTSIVVQFPATIVPLKPNLVVNKGENVSLFCNASGEPTPSVTWTHVNSSLEHNDATWVITDINVNQLGNYRCDASNNYGNASDSVTILFPGGKCEQRCTGGKRCRLFKMYLCFCDEGKKGPDCSDDEPLTEQIPVGIKINEEFKDEYEDLNNLETKKLVARIEQGCRTELAGTGLTNVRVTGLRRGSVIADVELTFNRSVSQDNIDTLLREATKDKKLGDIEVSEVLVGGKIPGPEETTKECNALFEGPDCKKAKPALIVICVIAGVIVLALLVAIVACSMHKKKSSGQTSFQNGSYAQRQDPEGNGTMDKGFDGNGGRIPRAHVNTAYQNDREEPTPMVTFNSNPAHTPGITLNDSSQTQKAQPGEGTYADLGQFHQKPATPTATAPAIRPPAYEETPYAEITQFLKGPVETDEVSPQEKEEEAPHETAGKEEAADGSLNEAVNEAVNEAQPDNLYPRLDADGGNDQQTEFVVAI